MNIPIASCPLKVIPEQMNFYFKKTTTQNFNSVRYTEII